MKTLYVSGSTELARAAAESINYLAWSQGRTIDDLDWYEEEINSCDDWIAAHLKIEEIEI